MDAPSGQAGLAKDDDGLHRTMHAIPHLALPILVHAKQLPFRVHIGLRHTLLYWSHLHPHRRGYDLDGVRHTCRLGLW